VSFPAVFWVADSLLVASTWAHLLRDTATQELL
jgi:hypothetical protein